jgi:hypothetical protein
MKGGGAVNVLLLRWGAGGAVQRLPLRFRGLTVQSHIVLRHIVVASSAVPRTPVEVSPLAVPGLA